MVPLSWSIVAPCSSAATMYMASKIIAGEFIVIELLTLSNGIPS